MSICSTNCLGKKCFKNPERLHSKNNRRWPRNVSTPQSLISVCADLTGINPDKKLNQLDNRECDHLQKWLKNFRLTVTGTRPVKEAIVTAGGVSLKEVDPRTMESKLVAGLYFAGEVLDVDADTGGFNLQAAFSTGFVAGTAAAKKA